MRNAAYVFIATSGLLFSTYHSAAQDSTAENPEMTPSAYVDNALARMQELSVLRKATDWNEIGAKVREQAEGSKNLPDTYDALRLGIELLEDKHAFLYVPRRGDDESGGGSKWVIASKQTDLQSRVLDDDIGYLLVPSFGGDNSWDEAAAQAFAVEIRRAIVKVNESAKNGWILDLRFNSGGNMWPMLAGLDPYLPAGEMAYFEDADRNRVPWIRAWGIVGTPSNKACDLSAEANIELTSRNVAVLINKYTLSSGEAVAVALKGKKAHRFFGEATGGASTATQPIWLGDGAMLFVTTALYVDRDGEVYGDSIQPDEIVTGGPKLVKDLKIDDDPVISAARQWLLKPSDS